MTTALGAPAATPAQLARRHDVTYEIWPIAAILGGQQYKAGYQLDLCGVVADGDNHLTPASPQCRSTFHDLEIIAASILPSPDDAVHCEIQPHDFALHVSPSRRFRAEVVLSILVLHNGDFRAPLNGDEERYLAAMVAQLRQLGIRRGR